MVLGALCNIYAIEYLKLISNVQYAQCTIICHIMGVLNITGVGGLIVGGGDYLVPCIGAPCFGEPARR